MFRGGGFIAAAGRATIRAGLGLGRERTVKSFRWHVAASVATVVMMGTFDMARAQTSSQAGNESFEITPHHTGISVPNLEESVAWYQRMLGFEVVRRVTPNPNTAIALLRRNNCYIELFQVAGAQPLPETRRSPTADLAVHGIKHFAFAVADARAAAAALKTKGTPSN